MQEYSLINLNLNKKLGEGEHVSFQHDRQNGDFPLACLFPNLHSRATDQHIVVAAVLTPISINLSFVRQLVGPYRDEWKKLTNLLATVYFKPPTT